MPKLLSSLSRRTALGGAAAVGALAASGLRPVRAQDRSLKVGTYGGYFEESFRTHIYPGFTEATGIAVESIPEPTGEQWLIQIDMAARAGQAPADVSMMANVPRLRGESMGLWAALDETKMPNVSNVKPEFLHRYADGRLYGVGAVSWFITLVTNTEVFAEEPDSWAVLWDESVRDSAGLMSLASNSFLLEIAAKTFFEPGILETDEGIQQVLAKLSELRPNVKLWYRDEGQFQSQLQAGEVPIGQYYHDVAGLAAADGHPVRSTFPKEGGVNDSGTWVVSKASEKIEEAEIFIDYISQASVQAELARKVGTAPVVPKNLTDLTDAEFASVSSDVPSIIPRYQMHVEKGDWIAQRWTEMITGAQ